MHEGTQTTPTSQFGFRTSEFPDSALVAVGRLSTPDEDRDANTSLSSSFSLDIVVYLVISALVLGAWQISRMGLFEAGDDTGYWLGVAGGSMMLLLFTYPLRKHFRFTRKWGRVKWWFVVHMMLGVGGPVLILLHSTFRVGSLNAGVAFYSMLAVALSGVIGRFIYARVNRGLVGEQATLRDLQKRAGIAQEDARSRLAFSPLVEARLHSFEMQEIKSVPGWLTYIRQVFWLPVQEWMVYRQCAVDIKHVLTATAKKNQWTAKDLARRKKHSRTLVRQYLNAVTRVAQYTAYERLFSLWHVAHIPFVYILVLSAIVHVVAVHAY
jgi:hypothetical protein